MSWPETTEHTYVLVMTQGFRNDLSFCSWPQKKKLTLWSSWYIACKWQFYWSKKNLGSGTKRKLISEFLGLRRERWCAPLFRVMTLTLNSDRSDVYFLLRSKCDAWSKITAMRKCETIHVAKTSNYKPLKNWFCQSKRFCVSSVYKRRLDSKPQKSRIGIKAKCKWIKIETSAVYLF